MGIDLFEPNIDYAQNNFGKDNLTFEVMRAEELGALGRRFDVIVLSDVLEHVTDPRKLLHDASCLLEHDGRLFVSIPNGWGPFEFESLIFRIPLLGKLLYLPPMLFIAFLNKFIFPHRWEDPTIPTDLPYNADSGHLQFFTSKAFEALINSNGLAIATQQNLSFLSGPYSNTIWMQCQWFYRLNNSLSNILPPFLVSAWAFELRLKDAKDTMNCVSPNDDCTGKNGRRS
jgi:SAM-dependent methyltransferase